MKDTIEEGGVELECCPTELIWVNVNTKTKAGNPILFELEHVHEESHGNDDEYGRTILTLWCYSQQNNPLLSTISTPTLKLDSW